jgi:hypothetical protein
LVYVAVGDRDQDEDVDAPTATEKKTVLTWAYNDFSTLEAQSDPSIQVDYDRLNDAMRRLQDATSKAQRETIRKETGWIGLETLTAMLAKYGDFDRIRDVIPDLMHLAMILVKNLAHAAVDVFLKCNQGALLSFAKCAFQHV